MSVKMKVSDLKKVKGYFNAVFMAPYVHVYLPEHGYINIKVEACV